MCVPALRPLTPSPQRLRPPACSAAGTLSGTRRASAPRRLPVLSARCRGGKGVHVRPRSASADAVTSGVNRLPVLSARCPGGKRCMMRVPALPPLTPSPQRPTQPSSRLAWEGGQIPLNLACLNTDMSSRW